jgi:hypothetical protein
MARDRWPEHERQDTGRGNDAVSFGLAIADTCCITVACGSCFSVFALLALVIVVAAATR